MTPSKELPASSSETKQSHSTDTERFNQTLKRMLETPPKPHETDNKAAKPSSVSSSKR